jgi:hypothetical protein
MSNRIAPKLLVEFIGTFAFVFIGAGTAAVVGDGVGMPGIVAVAFAHGLAIMAFAFAYGSVSGAHFNPAVTVGVLAAGAMGIGEAIGYIVRVAPKAHRGLGRAFSPAFRAGSLDRVGAEQSGAASMVSAGAMLLDRFKPPGRCSGCWPHDGEVAGGAPSPISEFRFIDSAHRVNLSCLPLRARGLMASRQWSARCYGVARQRDGSRQKHQQGDCEPIAFAQGSLRESDSKERLRVSNWIVQRLYDYAVKRTVEL